MYYVIVVVIFFGEFNMFSVVFVLFAESSERMFCIVNIEVIFLSDNLIKEVILFVFFVIRVFDIDCLFWVCFDMCVIAVDICNKRIDILRIVLIRDVYGGVNVE